MLDGVAGSIQIGSFKDVFFVQPGRGARNLRVDGEPLAGTRELQRRRRHRVRSRAARRAASSGGTLAIAIDRIVTAGDTAPPDLDELARESQPRRRRRDHADRVQAAARARAAAEPSGLSRATIGRRAGFAVLAVIAWFAFTAKSVALDIDPDAGER